MRELLTGLVPWGVETIVAIQAATGNTFDALFRAITWLGDAYVYLALLPLALWLGDARRGMRLALLMLLSMYVNLLLKDLLAIPRPFVVSSAVQAKDTATSFAFPSGHAQGVTTLWMGLAVIYRRRATLAVGGALILLVSFSRVYLGVHYPQDAIGGVLLGLAAVGAYRLLEPTFSRWWRRQRPIVAIVLCLVVPIALAALAPGQSAQAIAGAVLGLSLGRTIAVALRDSSLAPRPLAIALVVAVGLATAGAAYVGATLALSVAFTGDIPPAPAAITVGQTALVGLVIALGVPWLLRRDGPLVAGPREPKAPDG